MKRALLLTNRGSRSTLVAMVRLCFLLAVVSSISCASSRQVATPSPVSTPPAAWETRLAEDKARFEEQQRRSNERVEQEKLEAEERTRNAEKERIAEEQQRLAEEQSKAEKDQRQEIPPDVPKHRPQSPPRRSNPQSPLLTWKCRRCGAGGTASRAVVGSRCPACGGRVILGGRMVEQSGGGLGGGRIVSDGGDPGPNGLH